MSILRWSPMPSSWCPPPAIRAGQDFRIIGRFILYGASPRATIGLIEAGRALAYLRGRDYVLPADVVDIAARRAAPPRGAIL